MHHDKFEHEKQNRRVDKDAKVEPKTAKFASPLDGNNIAPETHKRKSEHMPLLFRNLQ